LLLSFEFNVEVGGELLASFVASKLVCALNEPLSGEEEDEEDRENEDMAEDGSDRVSNGVCCAMLHNGRMLSVHSLNSRGFSALK
jgi:hypothetical protein